MTGLPWPLARSRAHAAARPLPARTVELGAALGAGLAEPLRALVPLPPFDTSAMDGYAVCGPGPWQVVGRLPAGVAASGPLAAGTAVEIATGAGVPAGTLGVLPYEQATRTGPTVAGAVSAGRHVRRTGEECDAGCELLPSGTPVSPVVLGLAAAAGHDALPVHPRPRVAALVTGAELLRAGRPGDGRVRDAIGPQLPGLLSWAGGLPVGLAHLGDEWGELAEGLDAAGPVDVIVTTGASSAGPADHLRDELDRRDAQVVVDGVACRPGHPQLLARLPDGRWLVGLPGNPLAALVGVVTLVAPLLAGLAGRRTSAVRPVPLAAPLEAHPLLTRLVPVRPSGAGASVQPAGHAGSAMLRGAALADGLAVVPPGARLEPGALVDVVPLPSGG